MTAPINAKLQQTHVWVCRLSLWRIRLAPGRPLPLLWVFHLFWAEFLGALHQWEIAEDLLRSFSHPKFPYLAERRTGDGRGLQFVVVNRWRRSPDRAGRGRRSNLRHCSFSFHSPCRRSRNVTRWNTFVIFYFCYFRILNCSLFYIGIGKVFVAVAGGGCR